MANAESKPQPSDPARDDGSNRLVRRQIASHHPELRQRNFHVVFRMGIYPLPS